MNNETLLIKKLAELRLDRRIIHWMNTSMRPSKHRLPIFGSKAAAGFPSPADDFLEDKLTLDEILIKNPPATFLIRINGNSMINEGIHNNDLVIVDRSLKPQDGKIVVVAIDGEITVKKLKLQNGKMILMPGNAAYSPIEVKEESNVVIWGVVKTIIHDV